MSNVKHVIGWFVVILVWWTLLGTEVTTLAADAPRPSPESNANRLKARERMHADLKQYKKDELREIEALYQPSNDRSLRGTPMVKAALEKLIAHYPKANRAGCAMLYLAQWAQDEEREKLLLGAIQNHGDAFYGDGCQVGPYALFQLAADYVRTDQPDKAKAAYQQLKSDFATTTDHSGATLVSQIPADAK